MKINTSTQEAITWEEQSLFYDRSDLNFRTINVTLTKKEVNSHLITFKLLENPYITAYVFVKVFSTNETL